MGKTPKQQPEDVIEAELVYQDHWEGLADVARTVERVAGNVLAPGDASQVREVAGRVERAAKVGRQVEHAVADVKASVERLEEALPFKILRSRPSVRG